MAKTSRLTSTIESVFDLLNQLMPTPANRNKIKSQG